MQSAAQALFPAAVSPELLRRPLEFIAAEHRRQRDVFALMGTLSSDGRLEQSCADDLIGFLEHELSLHLADEEEDLFPLLRRRCGPEDEIATVLAELRAAHDADQGLAQSIIEDLKTLQRAGVGATLATQARERMRTFASSQLTHLQIENAIVLPMANTRLTDTDLANLTKRMTTRRAR